MTKEEIHAIIAAKAMSGLLASESEEYGITEIRTDPRDGSITMSRQVYPFKDGEKVLDYSKPLIDCPVLRTREQEVARQAVALANALVAELEKTKV